MNNKKLRRITLDAILAAAALIIFVLEAQVPVIIALPGVKLGLANVMTLFAMYILGPADAAAVLLIRIILGNIFTGQMVSFLYSLGGGALSFALLLAAHKLLSRKQIWAVSIISSIAHNIGQLCVAALVMKTTVVFSYLPYLTIAAIAAGTFTGICSQLTIGRIKNITKKEKD